MHPAAPFTLKTLRVMSYEQNQTGSYCSEKAQVMYVFAYGYAVVHLVVIEVPGLCAFLIKY